MMIKGFLTEKARQQVIAPKNNEPVSPIKIFAGWALKIKNARVQPIRINESDLTSRLFIPIKRKATEILSATEEESPSIPSVRLAQFIIPRRIIIAMG